MWSHTFIIDCNLPISSSGGWNESLLKDETLAQEIILHLQGIGKYSKAMDIVNFLDTPEMKKQLNHKITIYHTTAKHWMHKMGYCWMHIPKGQYVDRHKCKDIIAYCQDVFLSGLSRINAKTRKWAEDSTEGPNTAAILDFHYTVVWYHNESVFYANNWQTKRWVGKKEMAVP